MSELFFLLTLCLGIPFSSANIQSRESPWKYLECLLKRSDGLTPTDTEGEEIVNFCINEFLWTESANIHNYEVENDVLDFIRSMFEAAQFQQVTQKPKRIRIEYRMMTKKQRENYHRAVNLLKTDTRVKPNLYDAIANFHRGSAIQSAHFGEAFLPWHRILLLVYETALLEKVPDCILPYWDVTMDNELSNPADSVMFTDKFFGNPNGPTVIGPYRFWTHELGGALTRNVGAYGQLLSKQNIDDVLSRTHHQELVETSGDGQRYNLEELHGRTHTYIGGNMARLSSAPEDPIFYSYHAFIDCWWEKFRQKQIQLGIDPSKDYPITGNPLHHPDRLMDGFSTMNISLPMGILSNIRNFTNLDGYSNNFTRDIYTCADFPSCDKDNPDCGSPWLFCDTTKWVCVSKTNRADLDRLDATPVVLQTVQNRFEINGYAESDEWVYLLVKIIFERPPSVKFNSFPVHKGETTTGCDIYCEGEKAANITGTNDDKPKSYDKHIYMDSGFEKVYIQSDGINYDGSALEYAIVDQRFAISESVAYVPVRKPTHKNTEVLLTAFDSGGRLCRPYCRDENDSSKFIPCSGSLSIDNTETLLYGETYADIVLSRWEFDQDCPRSNNNAVFIKFFCNFVNIWPWEEHDGLAYSQKIQQDILNVKIKH